MAWPLAALIATALRTAAASTAACGAALHNATECHGQQISSLAAGGQLSECCATCQRTHGCGGFTFAPGATGTDCWLHTAGQGCALRAAEGRVAGVLHASPTPAAAATRLQAHAFNLSAVRLVADAGNQFASAQALNTQFLRYLDPDRLLHAWRMVAQLQPYGLNGSVSYGGWMTLGPHQHADLGHFSGHFLSASAFTTAATGDSAIRQKSVYLVGEIAKCQDAICAVNESLCGYVGADSPVLLDRLESHQFKDQHSVIVYYAAHKIMAGLLDTYEQAQNAQAWSVLLKMAAFFKTRIDNLVAAKGLVWWQGCLDAEFGGMNEVGYNLYAITGDVAHKQLGEYFYKRVFMDPIGRSEDEYASPLF